MPSLKIKKKTVYIWTFLLFVGVLSYFSFLSGSSNNDRIITSPGQSSGVLEVGLSVGNLAPDFVVTKTNGEQASLSDYTESGKPVVLYFMASWCPNCQRDLANVNSVYPKYSEDVEFLTVSVEPKDSATYLNGYKSRGGHTWDFAVGNPKISRSYGVRYTTTKFAIDSNGIIRATNIGIISGSQWERFFESVL